MHGENGVNGHRERGVVACRRPLRDVQITFVLLELLFIRSDVSLGYLQLLRVGDVRAILFEAARPVVGGEW